MLYYIFEEDAYSHGYDGDMGVTFIIDIPDKGYFDDVALMAMMTARVHEAPPKGVSYVVEASVLPDGLNNDRWFGSMSLVGDFCETDLYEKARSLTNPSLAEVEEIVAGDDPDESDMIISGAGSESARLSSVVIRRWGCEFVFWHHKAGETFRIDMDWGQFDRLSIRPAQEK